MKNTTIQDMKVELTRIKSALQRWQARVDDAIFTVDYLEKQPLLKELCELTGQPEINYASFSVDDLKEGLSIARNVAEKKAKDLKKQRDDPTFG